MKHFVFLLLSLAGSVFRIESGRAVLPGASGSASSGSGGGSLAFLERAKSFHRSRMHTAYDAKCSRSLPQSAAIVNALRLLVVHVRIAA